MGSPVSPIVANLYMEHLESQVLSSAPNPPREWFRFVDDVWAVIRKTHFDTFTTYLNSVDSDIKFTYECMSDNKLPFLDTVSEVKG